MIFVSTSFGVAYVAINVGEFSSALFPAFSGKENLIAAVIILALGILNWLGLRQGDFTQKLISAIKVIAFSILIIACFIYGRKLK
jgi:amino acid transporter